MTDTTDTLAGGRHQPNRPVSGQASQKWRLVRAVGYDVLLVPVGLLTMWDGAVGEPLRTGWRWEQLSRSQGWKQPLHEGRPARRVTTVGLGLLTVVLGLASLFLLLMLTLSIVRGPFWGFVEHGPVEPGTWGGPSRAGAWLVHGVGGLATAPLFLLALRGVTALHTRLVRPLYGLARGKWVLPATIVLAAGLVLFFCAWLQQA